MTSFDTYLPTELGKFLSGLNMQGRVITKIESPSMLYGSLRTENLNPVKKEYSLHSSSAEVDEPIYITLDDDRRIGFDFSSLSHVNILVNPDIDIEKEAQYGKGEMTVTDVFKNIIGKKIKDFHIQDTDDILEADKFFNYADDGFDEGQKTFIVRLAIIFEGNDQIYFENTLDFTFLCYQK